MITIIDYGMGNIGSIQNMLKHIGQPCIVTHDATVIAQAEKILLPGVGAFDAAMTRINQLGIRDILNHKARTERTPILGICLGMQLLTHSSEEGKLAGLGWVNASTHRFPDDDKLKVPHMGWNITNCSYPSPLTQNLGDEPRFYFVHSYYVRVQEPCQSILATTYGLTFDSGLQHDNIYGVQFHPEKSHKFGIQLLTNFARL